MSYLVTLSFIAIVGSLGAAVYFMLRPGQASSTDTNKRMARALAVRVGLSILLFVCIMLAWKLGYIHPTGFASTK